MDQWTVGGDRRALGRFGRVTYTYIDPSIHPKLPLKSAHTSLPSVDPSTGRPTHTIDSMMTTYGLVPTIADETRLSDARFWGGKWGKNKTGWKDRSNRIEGLDCCIPTHPRHPLRAVRSVPLWLSRRGRLPKSSVGVVANSFPRSGFVRVSTFVGRSVDRTWQPFFTTHSQSDLVR